MGIPDAMRGRLYIPYPWGETSRQLLLHPQPLSISSAASRTNTGVYAPVVASMSASLNRSHPSRRSLGTPKSDDDPCFHKAHNRATVMPPGFLELVKLAPSKIRRAILRDLIYSTRILQR